MSGAGFLHCKQCGRLMLGTAGHAQPHRCEAADDGPPIHEDCGKPLDSYGCRIRHISINTGWAKAAND